LLFSLSLFYSSSTFTSTPHYIITYYIYIYINIIISSVPNLFLLFSHSFSLLSLHHHQQQQQHRSSSTALLCFASPLSASLSLLPLSLLLTAHFFFSFSLSVSLSFSLFLSLFSLYSLSSLSYCHNNNQQQPTTTNNNQQQPTTTNNNQQQPTNNQQQPTNSNNQQQQQTTAHSAYIQHCPIHPPSQQTMLSSSSPMSSPFNLLLGDHASLSSPPSLYTPSSTPTSSRATFTRVSRGIPANNSTSLFTTSSTPPSNPTSSSTSAAPSSYFSLSKSPSSSSSSECTAKTTTIATTSPIYSHREKHSQQQQQQHGLNRFRPSLHDTATSDFLEDIHKGVQSSSTPFTALRRLDRKDIQLDPVLVLLSQDELAEKHVASASSATRFSTKSYRPNNTTDSLVVDKPVSKPCPTFTRISKPRTPAPPPATAARTGFYRLGDSGNSNTSSTSTSTSTKGTNNTTSKSTSAGLDLLLGSETLSFPSASASLLHEEINNKDKPMPSLSLSTSSPSSSCLLSPWSPPSSSLSLSSSSSTKQQQHQSLKAHTLLLPPLSLSLSPPPSSVPSLSSSASSACSSASSSSSPPTSHFLFPTVDHHDWWQGLGSPAVPSPYGLEQEEGGVAGVSRTAPGTGSGSTLNNSIEDPQQDLLAVTTTSTPLSQTFYRQQPQSRESLMSDDLLDKDPVVDHLGLTPAGSAGLDLAPTNNQNKGSSIATNSNSSIPAAAGTTTTRTTSTTPSTRKTYSLARARAPSPPLVITGFCSISKTPIKSSGEPSPQDFLGEADLPYPLPSTLHDRQTRQRKRAEQLRQLKLREECEAQEKNNSINRRKIIRRRGASFSTGMVYPPLSSTSLAFSPPSSSTSRTSSSNSTPSSPALFSDSPRMNRQQQQHQQHQQQKPSTTSFRSAAWHQQRLSLSQHLKRSPSSPTRGSSSVNNLHLLNRHSTCNIGQGSKEKAAMLSVLASLPSPPPRRRVVFDLENIQVFEYDISGDDWSPSSGPSSPTIPPASTNGRDSYVRYVPPSDCSSSGSSSDEEASPRPRVPLTRDLKSKA
ncbi:MAG: hypothetical protein J3R72DRAFT_185781, partial [Linnemannia gamsii]